MGRHQIQHYEQLLRLNQARGQNGAFLIEMLIALFVATMLAGALCQSYCDISNFGGKGQSVLLASTIAQEVIDSARDTEFANLSGYANGNTATYELVVNDSVPGQSEPAFPAIYARPLLFTNTLGTTTLNWVPNTVFNDLSTSLTRTEKIRFHARCFETITVTGTNQLAVSVLVVWNENGEVPSGSIPPVPIGCRSLNMQTVICQNGIHS